MPVGYLRALALLHRTFRDHPPSQRAHVLGRFLSAPILRTLDAIPQGSRVLDIGGGHGLLARLAVEERAREVVVVDPDLRKVMTAYDDPRVRFIAGFDECIRGIFDAVTIYDVVYRLPPAERDALFARVYARLRAGGVFILKEIDPSAPLKRRWNRMQERIVDILGLTVGENSESDTIEVTEERMRRAGFTGFERRRVDTGYPHAHILYIARKAASTPLV
jgi:cyclopropane fatty-acyl-phospholipid synthase-like methyltransferase